MGTEIERKFLIRQLPQDLLAGIDGEKIRQGYLLIEAERELRIREKGNRHWMTSKSGHGLERQEDEQEISAALFDMLWPLTAGRQIEKTRFRVGCSGLTLEIDIFSGQLAPLVLMEVEFSSVEESRTFIVPDYSASEVTDNKSFKNSSLAICGLPKSFRHHDLTDYGERTL